MLFLQLTLFESVYTSRNGSKCQDARDEVFACQKRCLAKQDLGKKEEDHIALELDLEQLFAVGLSMRLGGRTMSTSFPFLK